MPVNDWHSGFIESNGVRVHYTRTGGDQPPIVLAHGVTDAGPCWSRVAEALAPEFDVVMVDARGHGQSDAPERGYGPQNQAADLARVIAALGLRRPAILGHSMGAATALVLAGAYPDVPGAILLEDPPAWWADWSYSPEASELYAAMGERFAAIKQKTRQQLLADQRAEQPDWTDEDLQPWANAKEAFSLNVLEVITRDNAASADWRSVLPRVTCPALLITSDPDLGGIVNEESAAMLQALVPHLEIAHVPGAGHNIRRDQFEPFMEVVGAFLAKHAAKAAG